MAEHDVRSAAQLTRELGVHPNIMANNGPFLSTTVDKLAKYFNCSPLDFIAVQDADEVDPSA